MSLMMELGPIKLEGEEMLACRGCLATGVGLNSIHEIGLEQVFGEFTGFPVLPTDSYPQQLCSICQHLLKKFLAFRMRCQSAMYTLQQMEINNVKITMDTLTNIDRVHMQPNLMKTYVETISYNGSRNANSLELNEVDKTDNIEIKTLEEYMNETELDLVEDDDKPLKHFVTAMALGNMDTLKIKGNMSDDGIDADNDIVHVNSDTECPVKRRKVTRSTDAKTKKIKLENNKHATTIKNKTFSTQKAKLKKESNRVLTKKKVETKSKNKKETSQDSEQELLKNIANILRKIWQDNKNSNISDIWEMVYNQSQSMKDEDSSDINSYSLKKNGTTKHQIINFIELTKKLSKIYNMEVKFLSVEDHRKEIEDRRSSDKFANAPYRCEYCCKVYIFEDTFRRHMISHDPSSGDVECEICRYRFKSRKRYMNHFHIYHTKKIICRECGVVNRAWNFAKQHFKWHGGVTTVCEQCGKHFSDKKLYCMHVRAVHRAELATTLCLLCGDTYNGETGLRMHMDKTHRQAERCTSCGSMFRSADALSAHIRNVCELGCSSCPMCGDNFPSDEVMRKHYDDLHKREFKCEECNKSLATLVLYKRHMKRCLLPKGHEKRRREENKGKGIKQIYNLNLMCEQCGKGNFKCFSTLRSHQRVHTGERPFHCVVCQKTFRELQFLKNHMKTHTDERRYKCPFCPKAFRQMGHRAAHILTHTKERPYACTTCTKRYTGLTALKEHINTAHRGLPPRQRAKNKDKQEL